MTHPSDQTDLNAAVEQVLVSAISLHENGSLEEAEQTYRSVLELLPLHGHANYFLGLLLAQRDRRVESLTFLRTAVTACPDESPFWCTYIEVLMASNEIELAEQALSVAREMNITSDEIDAIEQRIQTAKGITSSARSSKLKAPISLLKNIERLYKAHDYLAMETAAREALDQYPNDGFLWKSISVALTIMKRDHEAFLATRKAAELLPQDLDAARNYGLLLERQGKLAEAEPWLRSAVRLAPRDSETIGRLAYCLFQAEQYVDAEQYFKRTLKYAPNDHRWHTLLAECYRLQGRFEDADAQFERSLKIKETLRALSARLFYYCEVDSINRERLYQEHLRYGRVARQEQGQARTKFDNERGERKLRIGFISGDLRNHAVAYYIAPVFEALHKRQSVTLYAYSNHPQRDSVNLRMRSFVDSWRDIYDLSDDQAEARILGDRIDILIDLSGHTAHNRVPLLSRRVAPIQAHWLGYPNTTGVDTFDYYITDAKLAPSGMFDDVFVEKFVQIPGSAVFEPSPAAPEVNALPAQANGHVTFGSFNRVHKLNRSVISAWSAVLHRIPSSRMMIAAIGDESGREKIERWFVEDGIDVSRLSFFKRASIERYLQQHHLVDVCLDAFPYSGATTTLHALWMGVPTLTIAGHTIAARPGISIAQHLQLDHFVADSPGAMADVAEAVVADWAALADTRASLRERLLNCPLGQVDVVTDGLEDALATMWRRWSDALPPQSFEVGMR